MSKLSVISCFSCAFSVLLASGTASALEKEIWFVSDIVNCSSSTNSNKVAAIIKARAAAGSIIFTTEANNCRDYDDAYTTYFNTWLTNAKGNNTWVAGDNWRGVPGNHDYYSSSYQDDFLATAFHNIMNLDADEPTYRFDTDIHPNWVIYGLDSELEEQYEPPTTARNLYTETGDLLYNLAYVHRPCSLAYSHRPAFSNGAKHRGDRLFEPLMGLLRDTKNDIIVSGHEHLYERLKVSEATGNMLQIVAGVGGSSLDSTVTPDTTFPLGDVTVSGGFTSSRNYYGALRIVLKDSSYTVEFYRTSSSSTSGVLADSYSAECSFYPVE